MTSTACSPVGAARGQAGPGVGRFRRHVHGPAEKLAWSLCGLAVGVGRVAAILLGRRQRVDVLVYKVDRLGDWLLAEPSFARILGDAGERGASVVIWGADEGRMLRHWREPGCAVESFALEPAGAIAKVRRAWTVVRLLSVYQSRTLICLRHFQEPIRDFVLRHADSEEVHALSAFVRGGPPGAVPHEISRHHAILAGAGLAPADVTDLLPRIGARAADRSARVVIAPFSSGLVKDWLDESWVEVARGLHMRGLRVELWVSPGQVGRAEGLARAMGVGYPSLSAAVRFGQLRDLGEAIAAAALVVSVDTFAAHLAVALDVPLVSLIGGGQYGDFGPWQRSSRQRWISNRLPCYGCDWQCSRSRVECMQDIRPARVLESADEALRSDLEMNEALVAARLNTFFP